MKDLLFGGLLCLGLSVALPAQEANYQLLTNLSYHPNASELEDGYLEERCVLDLYYPEHLGDFPTIVWFHGGGLTGGEKHIPEGLLEQGVAVAAVNYRLSPHVATELCLQDAAAAVSWVLEHIPAYGGDAGLVFVSGHSAGGYLASMIGLDKRWLAAFGQDADQLAGLIPFSGHTITHMAVRREQGIPETQPLVDEMAPLYHIRPDAPPFLLITGDRNLELLGRYEENAYFYRMMQVVGHPETRLLELDGYDHGMVEPAIPLLLREVKRLTIRLTSESN